MTQRFLITLLCFAIPFALYWLYERQRKGRTGREQWPHLVLWLVGAILAAETLVVAALTQKGLPEGRYVPAQLEDGRIIPPHVIPNDPPKDDLKEPPK
jgi:purine-cytosine permease-like protein